MKKILLSILTFITLLCVTGCSLLTDNVESIVFTKLPVSMISKSSKATTMELSIKIFYTDNTTPNPQELSINVNSTDTSGNVDSVKYTIEGNEGLAADASLGKYILKLTISNVTVTHEYEVVEPAKVYFAGGSGTEAEPYQITNGVELSNIRYALTDHQYFKLMNNIDISSFDWTPIGTGSNTFDGHLDGNGKSIFGLNFSKTLQANGYSFVATTGTATDIDRYAYGLFGGIDGGDDGEFASIKNLKLAEVNVNITNDENVYSKYVHIGALAGFAKNVLIDNVVTTGSINAKGRIGGFVGVMDSGTISNCTNNIDINAYYSKYSTNGAYSYAAGFVAVIRDYHSIPTGKNNMEKISVVNAENCVNNGDMIGGWYVAGFGATVSNFVLLRYDNVTSTGKLVKTTKTFDVVDPNYNSSSCVVCCCATGIIVDKYFEFKSTITSNNDEPNKLPFGTLESEKEYKYSLLPYATSNLYYLESITGTDSYDFIVTLFHLDSDKSPYTYSKKL